MSITMEELAKLANVSQGAVSLVLNGKARGQISQKKQDLIKALAKEYNYRINMAAKGLRKQRQYAVGVIMPGNLNLFYASLLTLLQKKFSDRGYMTLFSFVRDGNFDNICNSLCERQVDGIISWIDSPQLSANGIPAVVFDDEHRTENISSPGKLRRCGFDFRVSYRELFNYLWVLGHRKIGFIGNTGDVRCHLLRKFLLEKGIEINENCFFHHSDDLAGNNDLFDRIMTMPERPTVLVTTNDETARQLISEGARLGVRFPDDISITGFMNLPYTVNMYPALTTLDSKNEELAGAMTDILLNMIERPETPVSDIFIQPELIIRDSCDRPAIMGE